MRKSLLALAAATALATVASVAMPSKADAQVFVFEGSRYCFYVDGWHGPGWYRCGYRLRTDLGWGGEYGWHGWRNAGWERRGHHFSGGGANVRVRSGANEPGVTTRSRSTTTIRSGATMRGGQQPTTTGAGSSRGGKVQMNAAPGGGGKAGGNAPSGGGAAGDAEKNKP